MSHTTETWEAILPYADSDEFQRIAFQMPIGSTEGQARYRCWMIWAPARCGDNVQPSLTPRRVQARSLAA